MTGAETTWPEVAKLAVTFIPLCLMLWLFFR